MCVPASWSASKGVGGCNVATKEFAQGLAKACKKYGAVLICDEIQCGYGRSGKFFAHQWLGIRPDLITVAKGIVFEQEHLVDNAHEVGEYFINELKQLQKTEPHIKEVRGRGLMIGLVLDVPQKEVRSKLIYEQHVFTGAAGTDVLRILPPLCLTKADADDFIYRLKRVFAGM